MQFVRFSLGSVSFVMALGLAGAGCDGTLGGGQDSGRRDAARVDTGPLADTGMSMDGGPVDAFSPTVDDAFTPPDVFTPRPDAYIDYGNDQAVVVRHSLPSSLACSASTTATVTMRNTGDTTWSSAGNYMLQAVDSEDVFLTSGEWVALTADVPPGAEHTFTFALSAPGPCTETTRWTMVRRGVRTFGDEAASTVNVVCDGPWRTFPVVIDGTFTMPEHDQRIASRNAYLVQSGMGITGDDAIDNAHSGGGPPDGGQWLSGNFHFEIDAAGQNTSASWISAFGGEHYPVMGGLYGNGEIHMGSSGLGVDISGLLKNGTVTGYVAAGGERITYGADDWNRLPIADQNNLRGIWHGSELTFVHGRMSGTGTLR